MTYLRGDRIKTEGGGVGTYVGTTRTGIQWVAYKPEDFARLCVNFDRFQGDTRRVKFTRVPVSVLAEAVYSASCGAAAGLGYCQTVVVGVTILEADTDFYGDLVVRLRDAAKEFADGDRWTSDRDNGPLEFYRAQRVAKTLRKWAAKIERRIK